MIFPDAPPHVRAILERDKDDYGLWLAATEGTPGQTHRVDMYVRAFDELDHGVALHGWVYPDPIAPPLLVSLIVRDTIGGHEMSGKTAPNGFFSAQCKLFPTVQIGSTGELYQPLITTLADVSDAPDNPPIEPLGMEVLDLPDAIERDPDLSEVSIEFLFVCTKAAPDGGQWLVGLCNDWQSVLIHLAEPVELQELIGMDLHGQMIVIGGKVAQDTVAGHRVVEVGWDQIVGARAFDAAVRH